MNLSDKTVKKGYVIPMIIAVILSVLTLLFFRFAISNVPFSEKSVRIAVSDNNEIIERSDIEKNNIVSRTQLGPFARNTNLGIINFKNSPVSVIYNPYESVAADCASLLPDYSIIGEAGLCVCTLTKNNSSELKEIEEGDTLSVSTIYSENDYTLTAVRTEYYTSLKEVTALSEGVSSPMIIAADVSPGIGFDEEYLAVVFEVTDGAKVTA